MVKSAERVIDILEAAFPRLRIVVDDAQWFDDASASLGDHLAVATASRPWLMLVVRRPSPSGLRPAATTHEILLDALDEVTAGALIDDVTAAAPLRPQERDALVARAAGNPLFIGELLRLVRTSDLDALPDVADRVVWLERGRVAATGTAALLAGDAACAAGLGTTSGPAPGCRDRRRPL